jgi:Ca-activated chloride channel homolog
MKRLVAAWLVLVCGTLVRADQANFSAKTEHVRVDVLATERGRPILGLKPEDFEIVDNGVPQRTQLASFEQIPLNVIVVLDMSTSVAGEKLDHLRAASGAVLERLQKADQAALITFSHGVQVGAPLTGEFGRVQQALEQVEPGGDTALVDATYAGMMVAESDVGRALQIVFSDGVDTASWLTPDLVLDAAKRSDAVVYSVSTSGKPSFLKELSELTGGSLFEIDSTKNLSNVFLSVLEEFRHRYLVSYAPEGVARNGWHKLEVRVRGRSATVKARPGYLAGS